MNAPLPATLHRGITGLARASARHPLWVLFAWLVALVIAAVAAGSLPTKLKGGMGTAPGSDSQAVASSLAGDFHSPFTQSLVVIVSGASVTRRDAARRAIAVALALRPDVSRTQELALAANPVLLVGLASRTMTGAENAVLPMREAVRRALTPWPDCEAILTGDAAFGVDIVQLASTEAGSGERRALPFTLAALLACFGAPGAAMVPLLAGMGAVTLAMGLLAGIASFMPLSVYASNVAAMLGLGLGIDYALFGLSRVREEEAAGEGPAPALGRAAPAIALSGMTVLLALAFLAATPVQDLIGMGVGGAVVAATSVLAALTLLPALAALLGRWLDVPRFFSRQLVGASQVQRWRERASWIVRRPWQALILALLLLLPLAAAATRIELGFPEPDQLPPTLEATRGLLALNTPRPVRGLSPIHLLVTAPGSGSILSGARLQGLGRLTRMLREDARVSEVASLADPRRGLSGLVAASTLGGPSLVRSFLPEQAGWLLDRGNAQSVLEIFMKGDQGTAAQKAYVQDLRRALGHPISGLEGCRLRVGGFVATGLDQENMVLRTGPWIVLAASLVTLILLGGFTRSWLLPLKAVAANLLVVAAALGGTVLLLGHPLLCRLIGLAAPVSTMTPGLPLIVFCVVFGLSMDYEVFLLSRVVEAHRRGLSDRDAVVEGLGASAGVITGGAIVMAIVFAGFASAPLLPVKVLGVALALGVLLDATVVRLLLIPAAIVLVGKYNWMPGDRHEPRNDLI